MITKINLDFHINNDMNINIHIDININIDITPPPPPHAGAKGPRGREGHREGWGQGNPLWVYFHIGYRILDINIYIYIYMINNITSRPLYGGGSGVCVYFVYVYIVL